MTRDQAELERLWQSGEIVGKRVVIKRRRRTVVSRIAVVPGAILIDRRVGGFSWWNIADARLDECEKSSAP